MPYVTDTYLQSEYIATSLVAKEEAMGQYSCDDKNVQKQHEHQQEYVQSYPIKLAINVIVAIQIYAYLKYWVF